MPGRALSFGAVAENYERFRPGYPDEVADTVLAYAGRPIGTALEIGAGTGKATRLFAERGIAVTATDPDEDMLVELRKHLPSNVRTARGALEDLPPGGDYAMVYAASSLHWTEPVDRWPRVASMLVPGGVFASFGGRTLLTDPALLDAVNAARKPFLDSDEIPSPDGTPPEQDMQWPGTELQQSELFTDVRQEVVARRSTMTAEDYIGLLSTISAYLELPPSTRQRVYGRILAVLPATVKVNADLMIHLARRI
ncbi:class I SAM-dependent methyltransferase [Kutzneria sp. NPDC052558]|uniref:class I SAM-dependent methyltransferase n=1 Tax=Kutzneria sp. NPDC052558 TaxID=3364121 RepID=UPI0037CB0633